MWNRRNWHYKWKAVPSYNKLKNKVEEYRQKNSRLVQVIMQNLQKVARVGMVVKNMARNKALVLLSRAWFRQ